MMVFFMHVDCPCRAADRAAEADLGNGRGEDTNDYF